MIKEQQSIKKNEVEEEIIEFSYKAPDKKVECVFCGKHITTWIGSYRMCYECFIGYDW
jgi:hypothetical protein